ncbi:hypothetical protein RHMOL_Rhmol10G0226400 [Rhododendron molle]|uniref:Uncharacterized protein n=1 Tax=Rhododendron molle TaxID=49168 RepID=A0ACC0M5L4_RHOML|nr:hypothetical protein RHMOL_Rhmol10G0226400 [Rhododendron molle]
MGLDDEVAVAGEGGGELGADEGFWDAPDEGEEEEAKEARRPRRGGMESNSRSGTTGSPMRKRLCEHSEQAVLHTWWTDKNSGRRFFGCPYRYPDAPKTGGAYCDYFKWLNGPIGEQEKVVLRYQRDIRSLIERIVEYETKMEVIKMKCKEQEEKCKEHERKI